MNEFDKIWNETMGCGACDVKPSEDCRNCKKWNKCPCGKEGHENGTSIGYSIGECKDYEPCEDAVSRDDVDAYIAKLMSGYLYDEERTRLEEFSAYLWELPSVTPSNAVLKEAYIKGYDYGVKDWFKSKTQPSEDAVSREAVIEHICENKECYKEDCKGRTLKRCPDLQWALDLPSVTPERPKGTWLHIYKSDIACECSVCHIQMPITEYFHYCPNCGSYNGGNDNGDE